MSFKTEYYDTLSRKYIYESTGLPFNVPFTAQAILDVKDRIKTNKPAILIIDGGSGEGKTTLGIHVTEFYQQKPINYSAQLGMGWIQFSKNLKICIMKGYIVAIYDEAGDADKKRHWSDLNNNLKRLTDIFRTFKILVIIILPLMDILEDHFFDKKIPRLLLHCRSRRENYGTVDVYNLYRMKWLRKEMSRFKSDRYMISRDDAYYKVRPNFSFNFKNLPPEREKELDKISTQGKMKEFHEIDIVQRGLLSYSDMADKLGRSEDWVKRSVAKMKLKEEEIYRRKKYFSKKVFERIKNTI